MEDIGSLRPIQLDELDLMLVWRNDPKVRANMYTRHVISREEHLAWWDRISLRSDQAYFMYERDSAPMGIVAFNQLDPANANASWAFYAAPEAAPGTGSRMEYLALDHAFGQMRLHKLHCEVLAFNSPVVTLHQKFGFVIEGRLREHHNVDGNYVDIVRLGILASEWAEKRDEMRNRLARTKRKV